MVHENESTCARESGAASFARWFEIDDTDVRLTPGLELACERHDYIAFTALGSPGQRLREATSIGTALGREWAAGSKKGDDGRLASSVFCGDSMVPGTWEFACEAL